MLALIGFLSTNVLIAQQQNFLYISGKGLEVAKAFYPYVVAYTTIYDSLSLRDWEAEKALAIALGYEWTSHLSEKTKASWHFLNAYPEKIQKYYPNLTDLFKEDTGVKKLLVLNRLQITATKDTTYVTYGNRIVPNTSSNYWITMEFLLYTSDGEVKRERCQLKWNYLRRLTHAPIPEAYKIMWQYALMKCIGEWIRDAFDE